jgi:hypothetical protein
MFNPQQTSSDSAIQMNKQPLHLKVAMNHCWAYCDDQTSYLACGANEAKRTSLLSINWAKMMELAVAPYAYTCDHASSNHPWQG